MNAPVNESLRIRQLAAERDALQLALAEHEVHGDARFDEIPSAPIDSDAFDPKFYRDYYLDVAKTGMDPLEHYEWIGRRLGRAPNALRLKKKSRTAAGFWQIRR